MLFTRFFGHRNLYSRRWFQASALLLVLLMALAAWAQHRNSHKLRATAVLELTTDRSGITKARLVPVTILADGRFHDASIYERRPRPMVLDNGVVYEAQKSGMPVGYLTVTNSQEQGGIWIAGGTWKLALPPKKEEPKTAGSNPAASGPPKADDRPIIHRVDPNAQPVTPPASPAPQTTSTPAPPAATPPEPSQSDDPDRPTLRRHTTAQQQQEVENQPVTVQTAKPSRNYTPLQTPAGSTQVLAAVSDAQASETRSYDFMWKAGEQPQIEAKMRKLALEQFPRETPALTDRALKNVVVRSFDLDFSNDAVVVLTAELPPAAVPAPPRSRRAAAPATPPAPPVTRYIALMARIDLENNPQKLLVNITDSGHLDVTPRLELIDAVDVDGDGLAEILFREYGFNEKGFVIYGVGHGTATKVFEGATQPLHPRAE
jgi:hypothetical protein